MLKLVFRSTPRAAIVMGMKEGFDRLLGDAKDSLTNKLTELAETR